METLIVSTQRRNQFYSSNKSEISDRFCSSPSRGFKEINCRTFQSGEGILPQPFTLPSHFHQSSPSIYSPHENDEKSSVIPIKPRISDIDRAYSDDLCYSELWAGPAYSNSPPPSSLPIPKFSLRQKRSISLDLPDPASGIKIHAFAKSAPASPTRELNSSVSDFFLSTAYATQNLRRILHLDITDD